MAQGEPVVRPNDRRPPGDRAVTPACAAPFVAMEFDQFGDVQACCANALYPLGNVGRSSLREIWDGPRAQALRAALAAGDLSYGCSVCRHRLDHSYGEMPRDYYDNFPFRSLTPDWPESLQFSLHNTCNLECVMCGADRSSKIRSRRSHLAPLPHAYGDAFFEQLGPFLEHCSAADFSGGEPFLVTEHYRVWSMLAELAERPLCSLTTNGTVWNDRVEDVLASLDLHISVSMDGITRSTLEGIRVGTRFEEVMRNLDRFAAYTAERGTQLTITFSLVRQNWFELGAMLRFAEERGIPVKVQTVIEPEYGVQRLPTDDLARVVEALDAEDAAFAHTLRLNRFMWDRELARLRDELRSRATSGLRELYMEPAGPGNAEHVAAQMLTAGAADPSPVRRLRALAERHADALARSSRAELAGWSSGGVGSVLVDRGGTITAADLAGALPGAATDAFSPGTPLATALDGLAASIGAALWIGEEYRDGERVQHTLWLGRPVRDKVGLVVRTIAVDRPDGTELLVAADDHLLPAGGLSGPQPVEIRPRAPVGAAPARGGPAGP